MDDLARALVMLSKGGKLIRLNQAGRVEGLQIVQADK
jgi:hypothetical protein